MGFAADYRNTPRMSPELSDMRQVGANDLPISRVSIVEVQYALQPRHPGNRFPPDQRSPGICRRCECKFGEANRHTRPPSPVCAGSSRREPQCHGSPASRHPSDGPLAPTRRLDRPNKATDQICEIRCSPHTRASRTRAASAPPACIRTIVSVRGITFSAISTQKQNQGLSCICPGP